MKNQSWKIIGRNVKALREAIGLSQHDFALVTDLSKRTIANIEAGNIKRTEVIDVILVFFNLKMLTIGKEDYKVPENFRDSNIRYHKKINSTAIEILIKKPTIVYAIKFKLLNNRFFETPREIWEIRNFFQNYDWDYNSSGITNALQRMPELVEVQTHANKKNTNLYVRK